MFVVQFAPVLRVPLMGAYLVLFFIFNIKRIRINGINYFFVLLFIYFIFQNLLLHGVTWLDLLQSLSMIGLYIMFYGITTTTYFKSITVKDLKKVAFLLALLLPLFSISFIEWNHLRKSGILGNPNVSAHTLLLLFPFSLLVKPAKKYFLYIVLVVLFVIIVFASRSALLALGLGLGGYWLAIRKNVKKTILVFYALISLVLSYFIVDIAVYLFKLYLSSFSSSDSRLLYFGYNGRDDLFVRSMNRFHSGNQWLGLGFTNAKFEIERGWFHGTHNGFLDLLLRSGYIGFTIFVFILFKFLFEIVKIKNSQKRAAVFISYISVISLTTNSSTFFVFNFVFFYFIFIFNLARSNN